MEDTERLGYSVAETARLLHLSEATTYELCRQGKIASVRVSTRKLLVPRKQLLALLGGEAQAV